MTSLTNLKSVGDCMPKPLLCLSRDKRTKKYLNLFIAGAKIQKNPRNTKCNEDLFKKMAASYSPTLHCSTIGAGGLNFSVRNGKRWDPAAITT